MASSVASAELHPRDIPPAESLREKISTLGAFLGLALIDLVVGIAGFSRFYRLVAAFPMRRGRSADLGEARRVCVTVNRAATYYFKRAWCLQRSATSVCLLRRRGFAAELVIGAQKMPFTAHAWVEVNGQVLNDFQTVRKRYVVLTSC
jgi:hypothetical protein